MESILKPMKKYTLAVVLLVSFLGKANAAHYRFKKQVNQDRLNRELSVAGITHQGVLCSTDDACVVINPSKDPSSVVAAHVYVDPNEARKIFQAELDKIEVRLDDGTATVEDLRRAIKLLIKLR